MKKIIIAAVVIAILTAASALLIKNKNNTASAETVVMSLDGLYVSDSLTQEEIDAAARIDAENRIAVMLSELDKINSAKINIAADNLSVTAVLDISEELSQGETDGAVKLITMSLDGIEKEDVVIFDQNNNVIFSE